MSNCGCEWCLRLNRFSFGKKYYLNLSRKKKVNVAYRCLVRHRLLDFFFFFFFSSQCLYRVILRLRNLYQLWVEGAEPPIGLTSLKGQSFSKREANHRDLRTKTVASTGSVLREKKSILLYHHVSSPLQKVSSSRYRSTLSHSPTFPHRPPRTTYEVSTFWLCP